MKKLLLSLALVLSAGNLFGASNDWANMERRYLGWKYYASESPAKGWSSSVSERLSVPPTGENNPLGPSVEEIEKEQQRLQDLRRSGYRRGK